jgi:hypothetical protein
VIRSLRLRLLLIAVASMLIGWAVAAMLTYFGASRQTHELFDAQLAFVGRILATRTGHEINEWDLLALRSSMLSGAEQGPMAFQIWWGDGRLLQRTSNAPHVPLAPEGSGHTD